MALQPQAASNFFFTLDNYTMFSPLNVPPEDLLKSKALNAAYQSVFRNFSGEGGIFGAFRSSYESDPTLAAFAETMAEFKGQLTLVQKDTEQFMQQDLGGAGPMEQAVQEAFELFGQGVLFDERRNNEQYGFWSIHSMDSRYPASPPIGYYSWYIFVRAYNLVTGDAAFPLCFARSITIGAAVQNLMKPKGASGPTKTNPNNPPIPAADLEKIREQFGSMGFAELDKLYATAREDSPIGPPPSPPRL